MPELPDVEAIAGWLRSRGLVGRTITGATILWPKAIRSASAQEFVQGVAGRRIREIARRGKYLLLRLSRPEGGPSRQPAPRISPGSATLIVHLGMTGSLLLHPTSQERPRHTRNVFHLDSDWELCFADPRKLGKMWLVQEEGEVLAHLGPEPLEAAFTPEVLAHRLRGRDVPIKALLCDQSVVAGIGNIYADEALFLAGIHPLRLASHLSDAEAEGLHRAIVHRLSEAIQKMARLMPAEGPPTESVEGLELLLVPRSGGEPCSRCGAPVKRLVLRGRSAYYCPRCQPP